MEDGPNLQQDVGEMWEKENGILFLLLVLNTNPLLFLVMPTFDYDFILSQLIKVILIIWGKVFPLEGQKSDGHKKSSESQEKLGFIWVTDFQ